MDRVRIIKRPIANGNVALHLEYYQDGERRLETTNLYLVPEKDEHDKEQNRNALKKVVVLKAEKTLGIDRTKSNEQESDKSAVELVEYLESYQANKENNSALSKSRIYAVKGIVELVKSYLRNRKKMHITMNQLNARFAKDFIKFVIEEYQNRRTKEGRPVSDSYRHSIQQNFAAILNVAVREGVIRTNPFHSVDRKDLIPKAITQQDYLTVDEVKALMKLLPQESPVLRAFLFACFTGLRFSDVQQLTWHHIKSGVGGQYVELKMQKTKKAVVVPLSRTAMSFLPQSIPDNRNAIVFEGLTRNGKQYWIKKLTKQAGIEKDVHFHTSRHTFATLSLSAGVDIAVVSSILCHSTIQMTQIYAEVVMQSKIAAMKKVKQLM